jgi:hypothetical protein
LTPVAQKLGSLDYVEVFGRSPLPLHRLRRPVSIAAVPPAAATRPTSAAAWPPTAARPARAAARTRCLGIRHLHRDPATIELTPVELRNRGLSLLRRVHLDEPESPGLPGESVSDHRSGQNVAALSEELPEPFAGRGVRKTANVEFRCHGNPLGLSSALLHAPRTRKVSFIGGEVRSKRRTISVYTGLGEAQPRLGAWRPASHVERQLNSGGPMLYALILRYKVLGSIASSAAALPRWPFTCLSTVTMC